MAAYKPLDIATAQSIALDVINALVHAGLMSDWTAAEIFSERTGIPTTTLKNKHRIWPEGMVWQKAPDGRLYYSTLGFNKWMNHQAAKKCPQAFECAPEKLKSTSDGMESVNSSPCPTQPTPTTSNRPSKLVLK